MSSSCGHWLTGVLIALRVGLAWDSVALNIVGLFNSWVANIGAHSLDSACALVNVRHKIRSNINYDHKIIDLKFIAPISKLE